MSGETYELTHEWCEAKIAEVRRLRDENATLRVALVRQVGDRRICPICLGDFQPKDFTYREGCKALQRAGGKQ